MFWLESRDESISLCLSHKKREAREQESGLRVKLYPSLSGNDIWILVKTHQNLSRFQEVFRHDPSRLRERSSRRPRLRPRRTMSGDSKRQEVFDLALKGDLQQVVVRAKEDNRQAWVNFRTDISRVVVCSTNKLLPELFLWYRRRGSSRFRLQRTTLPCRIVSPRVLLGLVLEFPP